MEHIDRAEKYTADYQAMSLALVRQVRDAEAQLKRFAALAPTAQVVAMTDDDGEREYVLICPICKKKIEPNALEELSSSGLLAEDAEIESDEDDVTVWGSTERPDMETYAWRHGLNCGAIVEIPAECIEYR